MADMNLHRCLHCGGEAKLVKDTNIIACGIQEVYKVYCADCGCGTGQFQSAADAVARWQRVCPGVFKEVNNGAVS